MNKPLLLEKLYKNKHGKYLGRFLCNYNGCKKEFITLISYINNGTTKSCGCGKGDMLRKAKTKHNACDTAEYSVYHGILKRCYNKKYKEYYLYGGRGIKVCERWLGDNGFKNFFTDMGKRPDINYSIDRKNNDGDYSPENCYWATKVEQGNNTRRTIFLEFNGERHSLKNWARKLNIPYARIQTRHKMGWNTADILTAPKGYRPCKT